MKIGNRKKLIILGSILLFSVSMILVAQNGVAEDVYPITIDGSGVSTGVKIKGFPLIAIGGVETYDLEEGAYEIETSPGGNFAWFDVESNGMISYDPDLNGTIFEGEGTNILKIIGYPITFNASALSIYIKLYNLENWEMGSIVTLNLPADTDLPYVLCSTPGGILWNTSFRVTRNGVAEFNPEFEGKTLKGSGTNSLEVVAFPIHFNATHLTPLIKLYNLDYWSRDSIKILNLPADTDNPFVLDSNPGGMLYNTSFRVTKDGVLDYDPMFEGKTLKGLGTNEIEVVGFPIHFNATHLTTNIKLYNMEYWGKDSVKILTLPADTLHPFVLDSSPGGMLWNTSFRVTKDGVADYDPMFEGKTLKGLGTNELEVVAFPIHFNATHLSTEIKLYNLEYWSQDSIKTMFLPADTLHPFVLASTPGGLLWNTSFRVTKDGVADYDPIFEGKTLKGLGTNELEVVAFPILFNVTHFSTQIKLYNLPYWSKESIETMILPPDTSYAFVLASTPGGLLWNTSFRVTKDGVVDFDPYFDGKTLKGLGTNIVEVVAYPITLDAQDVETTKIVIETMSQWVLPGEKFTFYLPPSTYYPYLIRSYLGGLVTNGDFTISNEGILSKTEISFEYGIIRLTIDNTPPVTTHILDGTAGNEGYFLSDVIVTLEATDDISGVDYTEYSYDGIIWNAYTGSFTIETEGLTEVYYRSVDIMGNTESASFLEIKIDKISPETQLEINSSYNDSSGDIYVTSMSEFNLLPTDLTSGLDTTKYRINEGYWVDYTSPFTIDDGEGLYSIEYYSIDVAGNSEGIQLVTVQLANLEVDSYLSRGEDNPITQFDVIFTKIKQTGEFKLVATNPGQIFFITEVFNLWPTELESLDIILSIPEDFVLKGTEPIHVYLDGDDISSSCTIVNNIVTISNVPINGIVKVVAHIDYGLKGEIYPSLDDFGMIGYIFDSNIVCLNGDPLIPDDGLEEMSSNSATIISHQKKTTAIAGYIFDTSGNPIEGATVDLFLNGELISTAISDENGFYYFIDIAEGTYEVRVTYTGYVEIQVAVASRNELTELDFTIDS